MMHPKMTAPWKPGQSGNPAGYSLIRRRFAEEIKKRTADGQELLDYLVEQVRDPNANELIRFKAAELLLAYGFGKPKETPEEEPPRLDLLKLGLSPQQLEFLKEIRDKYIASVRGIAQRTRESDPPPGIGNQEGL